MYFVPCFLFFFILFFLIFFNFFYYFYFNFKQYNNHNTHIINQFNQYSLTKSIFLGQGHPSRSLCQIHAIFLARDSANFTRFGIDFENLILILVKLIGVSDVIIFILGDFEHQIKPMNGCSKAGIFFFIAMIQHVVVLKYVQVAHIARILFGPYQHTISSIARQKFLDRRFGYMRHL